MVFYAPKYMTSLLTKVRGQAKTCETRALFRLSQNFKFFHSLSMTSIFGRMYGALNIGKKTNCTI